LRWQKKLSSTGTELVTAIAAGYEVMIRTSLALILRPPVCVDGI
jgi:hypothetical protein